jgi:hypothetical protein
MQMPNFVGCWCLIYIYICECTRLYVSLCCFI